MLQKKSILIVDDEFGVRESLRMTLKANYKVHTAAEGKEALHYIRRDNIDLVTLDLKMPGLSGIDILREIKKINADIEVIIITAYGTGENAKEAIQYGAGDFIAKPFNTSDLINSVNQSLERRSRNSRVKNFSLYNSLVIRN